MWRADTPAPPRKAGASSAPVCTTACRPERTWRAGRRSRSLVHRCGSDAGADRVPADACGSSGVGVLDRGERLGRPDAMRGQAHVAGDMLEPELAGQRAQHGDLHAAGGKAARQPRPPWRSSSRAYPAMASTVRSATVGGRPSEEEPWARMRRPWLRAFTGVVSSSRVVSCSRVALREAREVDVLGGGDQQLA